MLMGIINASPDSYYKYSVATDDQSIERRAKNLEIEGADIIDVGAMSTAPYLETTTPLGVEEQRMRLAIEAVKEATCLPISVDTPRSEVAKLSVDLGADIINDITGLKYDKNMAKVVYESRLPLIMGAFNADYPPSNSGDIYETLGLLKKSISIAHDNMISDENMIIDPSIGFFRMDGNNQFLTKITQSQWYERDLNIISNLEKLSILCKSVCISVSNKSFIGHIYGLDVNDRLVPSLVLELLCFLKGVRIIRTHNIKQTRLALDTLDALPAQVIERMKFIQE